MSKTAKTLLIVGAVAVAAYLAWRWYQNRQAGNGSPTGSLGTNLNSVAPELVGGSSGPTVGPQVSAPVNITLNEQVAPTPSDDTETDMIGANQTSTNALARQAAAGGQAGLQPGNDMEDMVGDTDAAPSSETEEPGGPDVVPQPVVVPRAKPGARKTEPVKP